MTTWKELRKELYLTEEDENIIELEKELIRTMVEIRKEQGLSQAQVADICHVTQPFIARMESSAHSPQINSLLRVLMPLGYKLQIAPMDDSNK